MIAYCGGTPETPRELRGRPLMEQGREMANLSLIPVTHEAVFPHVLVLLSVDPEMDFDKQRAKADDAQARDKQTGERLWTASVMDTDPDQPVGQRELKVRLVSNVQPVPPQGVGHPVEFEGLEVRPWLDDRRTKPRIGISIRARAFRTAKSPAKSAA